MIVYKLRIFVLYTREKIGHKKTPLRASGLKRNDP